MDDKAFDLLFDPTKFKAQDYLETLRKELPDPSLGKCTISSDRFVEALEPCKTPFGSRDTWRVRTRSEARSSLSAWSITGLNGMTPRQEPC